jgi:hypothetical protein
MPAALYIDASFLWDLREPWTLGDPEIVYLITTNPILGRPNDEKIACLSDEPFPSSAFYLNQDYVQQTYALNPYAVQATYLTDVQMQQMEAIASTQGLATANVNVTVWENDRGDMCTLDKQDALQDILAAGQAIASLYGLSKGFPACADETLNPQKATTIRAAAKFFRKLTKVCGLLTTPGLITTALQVFG